ncbi:hypothetical protein [Halochromatium glycolicum]|nr:hypothetical protein [Halochromatium glycolicum]
MKLKFGDTALVSSFEHGVTEERVKVRQLSPITEVKSLESACLNR